MKRAKLKHRLVRWLDILSFRLRKYANPSEYHHSPHLRVVCCEVADDPPGTPCTDYVVGANGRCVYCDHDHKCHNFLAQR